MGEMTRYTRRCGAIVGIAMLAGSAACGNLTAGGATGEAVVVLSGDAADVAPAANSTPASSLAPVSGSGSVAPSAGETRGDSKSAVPMSGRSISRTEGSGDQPEGEVEAEFRLFLLTEDGELVSLTDTDVRVRVDLEGVRESEVADRVVPAARYTGLQIVFTEIEAEVDAGLIINGVPVVGAVDVELEDVTLPVTKLVDFVIGESDRVSLLIDLNAAQWLQAVDPTTAVVTAQVFADLITVVVR
jgi:hypothetical protein